MPDPTEFRDNLPFVGRKADLDLLDRSVAPGRIVAVVGPSGVGKSALVGAWARRRGDAVVVARCRNLSPVEVAHRLAERAPQAPALDLADAWHLAATHLKGAEVVIFDDVPASFEQLDVFCAQFSGAVITTGLEPPELERASVLPLRPLPVPTREQLAGSEVLELFLEAARVSNLRYDPDTDELDAIHELATRFGGLPLGLALAARRAATITAREVAVLVEQSDALRDSSRPERHRTVEAALGLSWEALPPDRRHLLYAMSLFRRPVRPHVLARLTAASLPDTLDGIESLVRNGILEAARFPSPPALLADYARRKLSAEDADAARAVRERAVRLAVELASAFPADARDVCVFGEGPSLWPWSLNSAELTGLDVDEINAILAAHCRWLRFVGPGNFHGLERLTELVHELGNWSTWLHFARIGRDTREAIAHFTRAAELAPGVEERHIVEVELAYAHLVLGDFEKTTHHLERASSEGTSSLRGRITEATSLWLQGAMTSEFSGLLEEIRGEVDRNRDADDLEHLRMLVSASMFANNRADLTYFTERALEVATAMGSRTWLALAQINFADLNGVRGFQREASLEHIRKAAEVFREQEPPRFVRARMIEGLILIELGDFHGALRAGRDAQTAKPISATDRCFADVITAAALWLLEDFDATAQILETMAPLRQGFDTATVAALWDLVEVGLLVDTGRLDEARASLKTWDDAIDRAKAEALCDIAELRSTDALGPAAVSLFQRVRELLVPPSHRQTLRIALNGFYRDRKPVCLQRLEAMDALGGSFVVANDFTAARVGGEWIGFDAGSIGSRLLQSLVESDEPLDFDALGSVLYPDETLSFTSLQNRINVAVSRLRKAGLADVLKKNSNGFYLDVDITLEPGQTNDIAPVEFD